MPAIYRSMFAINDIKNGTLNGIRAMPQKDLTSDGEHSFAMDRSQYIYTLPRTAPSVSVKLQKKWFGNRDASQVTTNRRVSEIGVGSLNSKNAPMSFTTQKEVNTVDDALRRVRAGGAVVPPKVTHKKTNAPTPGFPTGILQRTQYRSVVPVSHYAAMATKPVSAKLPKHFH